MTTEETTEHADEIEGVIHQPTLPTMELPDYHGRKPVGMKTALAGAGTRVTRNLSRLMTRRRGRAAGPTPPLRVRWRR